MTVTTSKSSRVGSVKKEAPPAWKVVLRRLPAGMTWSQLEVQLSPLPDSLHWKQFVPADPELSPYSFARCYLSFSSEADVLAFSEQFNHYVFVDDKGGESCAQVELAPYASVPIGRREDVGKDKKCGIIEGEPEYASFLEEFVSRYDEARPRTTVTIEQQLKELELRRKQAKAGSVRVTPLTEAMLKKTGDLDRRMEEKRRLKREKVLAKLDEKKALKRKEKEERKKEKGGEGGGGEGSSTTPGSMAFVASKLGMTWSDGVDGPRAEEELAAAAAAKDKPPRGYPKKPRGGGAGAGKKPGDVERPFGKEKEERPPRQERKEGEEKDKRMEEQRSSWNKWRDGEKEGGRFRPPRAKKEDGQGGQKGGGGGGFKGAGGGGGGGGEKPAPRAPRPRPERGDRGDKDKTGAKASRELYRPGQRQKTAGGGGGASGQ